MAAPEDATPGAEEEMPPGTTAAWRRAEDRLYQVVLSSPQLYRDAMELVGRTVEHLRALGPGTQALLAAAAQGGGLVTAAVRDRQPAIMGLDLSVVAEAALALRHREAAAERASLRRADAIEAARRRGEAWVVLEASGDPDGDPFLPYRRLEVEVSTGRALLVTAAPDEDFRACVHGVQVLGVDPDTGRVQQPREDLGPPTMHPSAAAREEQAAALREWLSPR